MRQRVFVLWEDELRSGVGEVVEVDRCWKEFPDVSTASAWMDTQTGRSCVMTLGGEVIEDVRPNGGASAIASDLARRSGRALGRGRKRK